VKVIDIIPYIVRDCESKVAFSKSKSVSGLHLAVLTCLVVVMYMHGIVTVIL